MTQKILEGKVALITGAGGGLGRAHALSLARAGAHIVVNDLGSARDGTGQSKMADKVVEEIVQLGGQAVANYGSVASAEDAQAMVEQAIEAFGRLDIVINNAGILRDKTLLKMTDEMWDLVQDVHLKGTFLVTRAAVKEMIKHGWRGRIVNTTSYAGLKGNFGQTNYAAAKAGIAGLTRTVALETQRAGITVNALAPVAKTRMTEDIDMIPAEYEPEDIAPLVLWLVSDDAENVTGRVFGAHGSHYFEYIMEMTRGVDLGETRWTHEMIVARLGEITQTEADRVRAQGSAPSPLAAQARSIIEALPSTLKKDKVGLWKAIINFTIKGTGTYAIAVADGTATFSEGEADGATGTISFDGPETLIQLASGKLDAQQAFMKQLITTDNMGVLMKFAGLFDLTQAGQSNDTSSEDDGGPIYDGVNPNALGTKYKGSANFVEPELIKAYADATEDDNPRYDIADGQVAPPLYAVRPLIDQLFEAINDEELGADVLRLVHGEQVMVFHRPLKVWDLVASRAEITSIEDKSSGQIVRVSQWLMCDGERVVDVESALFIRAKTKKAGDSKSKTPVEAIRPEPVYTEAQAVTDDQSHRYAAISNDRNPIHTDPAVAKAAGLPDVILHGLCTMAMATKAVVNGTCDGDPARLKQVRVRFARPVFNGDMLSTTVWVQEQLADRTVYGFETVNQHGAVVLSQASAEVLG